MASALPMTEPRRLPGILSLRLLSLRAIPVLLALSLSTVAGADQNDARLDELFERIKITQSPVEADRIEREIWRIWVISNDLETNKLMEQGIQAFMTNDLDNAIRIFSEIIVRSPKFAEGWNKRATAYYQNGDLAASVKDIESTLALEPRHFGAISGMGLIFLHKGDRVGALEAFERVLQINPHARGAREFTAILKDALKGQGV